MKIQPAAGDGSFSTKVVLLERENLAGRPAVPVLKMYFQRMKIQPADGDGRDNTTVVLREHENGCFSTIKLY